MSANGHFGRNVLEKSAEAAQAAHAGFDRRALRTRQSLHHALLRLILERDYDDITVGDITDTANVGRSTFYAHFTDKDDLLRTGTEHLRAMILHEHKRAAAQKGSLEERLLGFSAFMTAHLKEQHQLYRALMRGRAGPIIIAKLRQILGEILRAEFANATDKRKAAARQSEVAVQFVVGAYVSIVTWWLDRGGREPPAEINRAFRQLAMGSLRTMFTVNPGAKA
jgi:AcrR family transcriptional regulator